MGCSWKLICWAGSWFHPFCSVWPQTWILLAKVSLRWSAWEKHQVQSAWRYFIFFTCNGMLALLISGIGLRGFCVILRFSRMLTLFVWSIGVSCYCLVILLTKILIILPRKDVKILEFAVYENRKEDRIVELKLAKLMAGFWNAAVLGSETFWVVIFFTGRSNLLM